MECLEKRLAFVAEHNVSARQIEVPVHREEVFDAIGDAPVLADAAAVVNLCGSTMTMNQSASIDRTDVSMEAGRVTLKGELAVPDAAQAAVILAHGSGSTEGQVLTRRLAERLNESDLATLCADLLAAKERKIDEGTGRLRFDVRLLADRLGRALAWVDQHAWTDGLPIGLFASGTGAAAALRCAADHPAMVGAVVAMDGRPDLAQDALSRVVAPVLMIVGDHNRRIAQLNRMASQSLKARHRVELVSGWEYGFEEPGKLQEVGRRAAHWYHEHVALPG
jgi:dienelactone hydrolase